MCLFASGSSASVITHLDSCRTAPRSFGACWTCICLRSASTLPKKPKVGLMDQTSFGMPEMGLESVLIRLKQHSYSSESSSPNLPVELGSCFRWTFANSLSHFLSSPRRRGSIFSEVRSLWIPAFAGMTSGYTKASFSLESNYTSIGQANAQDRP